ncbi:MAG: hypothetical protein Q9186_000513 [Xanthomendoza sp. 1 TL-2023]
MAKDIQHRTLVVVGQSILFIGFLFHLVNFWHATHRCLGMLTLLQRIKHSNVTLKGDLEFVNNWQYFSLKPSADHDQLTTTGPYAGTLCSFAAGTTLRTRYLHLLPHSHPLNIWASDCPRVIETARYFATGFFGLDWDSNEAAKLHIIPETPDLGADTLTPGDTCLKYRQDLHTGHDYGLIQLGKFRSTYLPAIGARFHAQNPGIRFTDGEIYSMQEMCGFELLVRGRSPWCGVFSHDEWLDFEYARDVIHYYRAGPGNRFGPTMGWLWLNATANLLAEGPDAGTLFFSLYVSPLSLSCLAPCALLNGDFIGMMT